MNYSWQSSLCLASYNIHGLKMANATEPNTICPSVTENTVRYL